MKLDLHIHSKYSYDSFSDPAKIIRVAESRGLDAISITDHDSFRAYNNLKLFRYPGITVIPGMEIRTDRGDVIGLFISEGIAKGRFEDVADAIRRQGGIVVLPHPYRRKCDPAELVGSVDLVETINSRSDPAQNEEAGRLCMASGKKAVAGSDAHNCLEIGRAVTEIAGESAGLEDLRRALLSVERTCSGRSSPYYLAHGSSLLSSRFKRLWGMT